VVPAPGGVVSGAGAADAGGAGAAAAQPEGRRPHAHLGVGVPGLRGDGQPGGGGDLPEGGGLGGAGRLGGRVREVPAAAGAGRADRVFLELGGQYADVLDGIARHQFEPFGGVEVGVAPKLDFVAEGRPRGRGDIGQPLALTLAYRYGGSGRLALTWANNGLSS